MSRLIIRTSNQPAVCVLRRGFTLVELLVVIGIIALLISILLPSLAGARRSAQRVACSAKLQQIMVSANIHASEHAGYYPICGLLGDMDPWGLNDGSKMRYDYFQAPTDLYPNATNVVAPITFALAKNMGYKNILDAHDNATFAKIETDPVGMIKNFWCPSLGGAIGDSASISAFLHVQPILVFGTYSMQGSPLGSSGYLWYQEAQTYIFNEQVLGLDDNYGRLRGKASAVRQAASTMFAADGLGSSIDKNRPTSYGTTGFVMSTLYSNTTKFPVTMGDVLSNITVAGYPKAGDVTCFDMLRHRGKINIAFCDGHVETRSITINDLQRIYLMSN